MARSNPLALLLNKTVSPRLLIQTKRLLTAVFIVLVSNGCQTTDKKSQLAPAFTYPQSIAADLIVDQKTKSFKIRAEINMINSKAVRFDLRTTLDLPLASIVLTDTRIEYVLFRTKKYYSGKPNPHALDPLFPLALDVESLTNILNEMPNSKDKCDAEGELPVKCEGTTGDTKYVVKWEKRGIAGPLSGRATKVTLELPERNVELRFYVTAWDKNVSDAERFLRLDVPEDFKRFSVPSL